MNDQKHSHHKPGQPGSLTPSHRTARLMRLATYASVAVASVLIGAKAIAFFLTDSIAILSTLTDSVLDMGASLINLYAVRHALQPADSDHRFGHGKAESVAGLGQAAFIGGSAVFLIFKSIERVITPHPISHSLEGLGVIALSIVLTLALVAFQRHVVKQTDSVAIRADSLHYKTDLLVNTAVAVALVLSTQFGVLIVDPLFGLAISGYILWSAWQIARESLDMLMDRELPNEDRQRIIELVMAHSKVEGIHDLRSRSSGLHQFIQFHIEMDPEMQLLDAHQVADEVMWSVEAEFPRAEVLVHQDPVGVFESIEKFD